MYIQVLAWQMFESWLLRRFSLHTHFNRFPQTYPIYGQTQSQQAYLGIDLIDARYCGVEQSTLTRVVCSPLRMGDVIFHGSHRSHWGKCILNTSSASSGPQA